MEEPKLTIGHFELNLYALMKQALASGVREEDLWASFEACLETVLWARAQGFENGVPIKSVST
jgi:hypothetical protein